MMLSERGKCGQIPVIGMGTLRVAKAVLGVEPRQDKDRARYWTIPEDWPVRLRRAGIDPGTCEIVDMEKWLNAQRAVEQRRELQLQERARRDVHEGLKEATAKYRAPAPPRPSELIRNHVLTGRIVRELRKGDDST